MTTYSSIRFSIILLSFSVFIDSIHALQTPIPPPPPVSVPVYSLATIDPTLPSPSSMSMNIVTFSTLVSINPRLYMVSLYHGTKTKDAFMSSKYGILQLLSRHQEELVVPLGKRSGNEEGYNKDTTCAELGYEWVGIKLFKGGCTLDESPEAQECFDTMKVLPRCQSYIKLKMINRMDAGDHELTLCEVLGVGRWDERSNKVTDVEEGSKIEPKDEKDVLYTGYLRERGIL